MPKRGRVALHISAALSLLFLICVVLTIINAPSGSQLFPTWFRELRWEPSGVGFTTLSWFDYRIHLLTNANVASARVNLWILLGLFCVMPIIWLAAAWQRYQQRRPSNACKHCGYDLTGNLNGICPECGTHAGIRWRIIAQFGVERMKSPTPPHVLLPSTHEPPKISRSEK